MSRFAAEILRGVDRAYSREKARLKSLRRSRLGRSVSRPSGSAITVFFHGLALMLKGGVDLRRALRCMSRQSEEPALQQACIGIHSELCHGHSLSTAMRIYPNVFNRTQVQMVQVGEKTGQMDEILAHLARYEEKAQETAMKVRSAVTYPALIFCVCLGLLVLGPPFLFGGLMPLLKGMDTQLPWLTRVVIAFSEAVRSPWWLGLLLGFGCACYRAISSWLARSANAYMLFSLALNLPIAGRLLRALALVRFSRTFAIHFRFGGDVLSGLILSAQSSMNPVLQDDIKLAVEGIVSGKTLTRSLELTDFFPRTFLHMVRAGEETGETAEMLAHLTIIYEEDLDCTIAALVSLVEPLIMLVMGLLVGILLVALMLPLMKLVSTL